MKKLFFVVAMFVSLPSFAFTEEDEISKPMHYALIPSAGLHLGISELSGSNTTNIGFFGGIAFRFLRDGYFFTPGFRLVGLVGLDQSPLTMWTAGFIAGGHLNNPSIDLFMGLDVATIIAYKTGSSAMLRAGTIFDLGLSDFQIVLNAFYATFSQTTDTKIINFPYVGAEIALQFPIDL